MGRILCVIFYQIVIENNWLKKQISLEILNCIWSYGNRKFIRTICVSHIQKFRWHRKRFWWCVISTFDIFACLPLPSHHSSTCLHWTRDAKISIQNRNVLCKINKFLRQYIKCIYNTWGLVKLLSEWNGRPENWLWK